MKSYCPVIYDLGKRHEYIVNNWILISSTDIELLSGFLLTACRHLSMVEHKQEYEESALQYKLRCVEGLRSTISAGILSSSRMAVTKALVLVSDEVGKIPSCRFQNIYEFDPDYASRYAHGCKTYARSHSYHPRSRGG